MDGGVQYFVGAFCGFEFLATAFCTWQLYKQRSAFLQRICHFFFSLQDCRNRTIKENKINEGVQSLRVRLAWTLMALLGAQVFVANLTLQLNILTPGPNIMTLAQMWTTLALLMILSLPMVWPSIVRSSTLDTFYLCITALCVLFVSPWHIAPASFVKFSMIPTAFIRMPTVILASRISVVILCNLMALFNVVVRALTEDFVGSETGSIVCALEVMSFFGVVTFAVFMNSMIRQRVETQVHCDSMAEELSAAGSLLRVTCDAVIELDPKLCLTNHSPELSAMLLRDRPGSTLRGKSFLELMPPEEVMRARDFLTKKFSSETSLIPQISAEAFHTRLVDSASSRIRVEVFQVKFEKGDGKTHSLLGLRDFTDVAAISAPDSPAPDSPRGSFLLGTGDEQLEEEMMTKVRSNMTSIRSSVNSNSSRDEVWSSQTLLLDLDMEGMVVHAASASLSSWIGLSVHEVFPSLHTTLLFQRLCRDVQENEERNYALAFQELPVKGTKITGTMRPTKNRFGQIHVVLAFLRRTTDRDRPEGDSRSPRKSGRDVNSTVTSPDRSPRLEREPVIAL